MTEHTDLLLVPLDDTVLFPGMTVTIVADVGDEDRVLIVPRHDDGYAAVGTVAEVIETGSLPGSARAATVHGIERAVPGAARTGADGKLRVSAEAHSDEIDDSDRVRELEREYRAVVEEILDVRGADERIRAFVRS
ncbi:MAG: LON peptidase substrate-binding domain-containing protein, partial [Thermoleophilia bacterium]|nr:LON peptidase substrate-binding domain-containing protein [Thermoleophilia bacterium]